MRFIDKFEKFFESTNISNDEILEFLTTNSNFKDPRTYRDEFATKYFISNDGVDIYGNISFEGRGLDKIPFHFRNVNGIFNCSNNKFTSFEFLPIECKKYILNGNPGFTGVLEDVWYRLMLVSDPELTNKFFSTFVQECLSNNIWMGGVTNWNLISEVYSDTKLMVSSEIDNFIKKFRFLIDYTDKEILSEYLDIKNYDINTVVNRILDTIKSPDNSPFSDFEILYNIWVDNKSECEEIFTDWDIKETILSLFNKIEKSRSLAGHEYYSRGRDYRYKVSDNSIKSLILKIRRNPEDIEFEREYDTFVFIGRDKFEELPNGSYKRKLEIENLYKIDKYDPSDQSAFNMMKLRANSHQDSKLYYIHIPKGALEEKSYLTDEIPEYLIDLIDKKKTRI